MADSSPTRTELYGLLAEFDDAEAIVHAATEMRRQGYRQMDAYSPFPVEGLAEATGFTRTRIPVLTLLGGIIGCVGGYFLQYWIHVIDYPINVGGRPLNSVPAFVPAAFECTVLLAALTASIGMILRNGLPRPYHPVFNVSRFSLASNDHFFLCIEAMDPKFNKDEVAAHLHGVSARAIYEVPT